MKKSLIVFLLCLCGMSYGETVTADITGDGIVDLKDFQALSEQWLATGQPNTYREEFIIYTGNGTDVLVPHHLGVMPKSIFITTAATSSWGPMTWMYLFSTCGTGHVYVAADSIHDVTATKFNVNSACHKNQSGIWYYARVSWWPDTILEMTESMQSQPITPPMIVSTSETEDTEQAIRVRSMAEIKTDLQGMLDKIVARNESDPDPKLTELISRLTTMITNME